MAAGRWSSSQSLLSRKVEKENRKQSPPLEITQERLYSRKNAVASLVAGLQRYAHLLSCWGEVSSLSLWILVRFDINAVTDRSGVICCLSLSQQEPLLISIAQIYFTLKCKSRWRLESFLGYLRLKVTHSGVEWSMQVLLDVTRGCGPRLGKI